MNKTFEFINSGKPHLVAAAFAVGREQIIPDIFRALLNDMHVQKEEAPAFHYYLERHIHLDGDHHGPISLQLLNELCGSNPNNVHEAETAAYDAIQARIEFWDEVLITLTKDNKSCVNA